MDNAARKISLIKWLSHVEDDATLKKVEALAHGSVKIEYRQNVQPQTDEELEQLINESEEAYRTGKHTSHQDVKKRFNLD